MNQEKNKSPVEVCNSCETKIAWMEYCIQEKIPYPYMESLWEHCHAKSPSTIDEDTPKNDTMLQCLKEFRWVDDNSTSLVLQGPPGCGKTNWAKKNVKLPSLFVTHLDRLRDFRVGFHQSIIFDDLDFKHLPRTSQIHLVDRENPRDIHVRYRVAHIPAGVQKVFTCNDEPFIRDDAIRRRTKWKIVDPINHPFI